MAFCETENGPDRDSYGSLACDRRGCRRRYAPPMGSSDYETLQIDARKLGWDCYVAGPMEVDRVDLCPKHRRLCSGLVGRSPAHTRAGLADLPCGKKMREVVDGEPLCGTHANARKHRLVQSPA